MSHLSLLTKANATLSPSALASLGSRSTGHFHSATGGDRAAYGASVVQPLGSVWSRA